MAYIINKTNGEQLLILEDGTLNTDTSVGLLGKNTIGYGEVQNENFIHLLENFAGNAPPAGNALKGQVYFNTISNQLNVYDGTAWQLVGDAIVSAEPPATTISGSTWIKTSTQQLYVYNNGWQLIGPEAVEGFGLTRCQASILEDNTGVMHSVVKLVVNGTVLAIASADIFTIGSTNAIPGFNSLKAGITMSTLVDLKGNLDGNAVTATKLQNPRTINGQPFDGSADIVVTATASKTLTRGRYLTGDDFNGGNDAIWSIDASTATAPNKIVVRDDVGDFAARNITANLIGNVSGNISTLTGTSQFNEIVATQITGNLTGIVTGNADTATKLKQARSINGVLFDGTQNIVLKATATNPLVAGQYVQGDQYDGSVSRSWNVLATPNNDASKIVARDSNGSFAATTVTANVVGNIVGNVTSSGISNFNVVNATQLSGNLTGNASGNAGSATRLQYSRAINGVLFDGTSDINIKASTPQILSRGAYLTGNNFDGGAPATWAVDASVDNIGNRIVARNASGNFSAGTITANLVGNVNGNITGVVNGSLVGNSSGTHTGNVFGNVTGTVYGNVQGGASDNIFRTGDTLTGRLGQSTQGFVAASAENISNRINSGFYETSTPTTSEGWPVDGGWHHLLSSTHTNDSNYYAMQFVGDFYNSNNIYYRATSGNGLTAWNKMWHSGNDGSGSGLDADTLDGMQPSTGGINNVVARDSNGSFSAGTIYANLIGSASANISRTGDSMSGYLTLAAPPVNAYHAATKSYVEAVAAGYTFTYGNTWYTNWFTNWVGNWYNGYNYFDVFPPYGKSMGNLVAFIPSIAVIHFAGGVNGDDSMRCTWTAYGDRIRVWVQNTEQRSTPAGNWLAVWR